MENKISELKADLYETTQRYCPIYGGAIIDAAGRICIAYEEEIERLKGIIEQLRNTP
jgi:hypothetical protein